MSTMGAAIAISSPSGSMSKISRKRAIERLRFALFGDGLQMKQPPKQPTKCESLLREASELRELAARGMKPRAYLKRASMLEAMAAAEYGH